MFSDFGTKMTGESGILQLMEDLGSPIPDGIKTYSLGGGNPAQIPEIEMLYRTEMESILKDKRTFENLIGKYDGPKGNNDFIEAVASYISSSYGWNITAENICICNGSQSACFYLFNLLSGTFTYENNKKVKKTILFPLVPEYVGYADQGIESGTFASIPSKVVEYKNNTFKYFVDFEKLELYLQKHNEVGALCASRPTNPTGNVLTDDEVKRISLLAKKYNIPFIIDNAYGLPCPHIIFNDDATPYWDENIILSMSLSKIGLPSLRTGIIIAKKEIVDALSKMNSIVSLASGTLGQAIATNLIKNGTLVEYANKYVKPFYEAKNKKAQDLIHKHFAGGDYAIHKGEGSIFLWILMKDLKITTKELYRKLKDRGIIVVPGEYFFYGNSDDSSLPKVESHEHYNKCLRLNYARSDEELEDGIKLLAQIYKENRK